MNTQCTGPCKQGRIGCPTPDACEVAEEEVPMTGACFRQALAIVAFLMAFVFAGPMVGGLVGFFAASPTSVTQATIGATP